jgi:hypothetical protein
VSVIIVDEELLATPGAAAALDRLRRAGHTIVGGADAPSAAPAWHLTASPEACIGRSAGLTTILVGPRRPPERGPARRCDLEARDVAAAALEILTREAMPDWPAQVRPTAR